MTSRLLSRALLVLLAAGVIFTGSPAPRADAAPDPALFDPGLIISDQLFFDGNAMTASEIQSFLDARVLNCRPGYTCLKDYRQSTPTIAADAYCDRYTGSSNERASDILYKVGKACQISQKVLLVLLQKEMSLVTHDWPSDWRYDKATGYACSDSSPCDTTYSGFVYQVYYAARQYQRYAALPTRYNYQAGRTNNILFHPSTSCGTAPVFITNQATAGLYNYTPYQPNKAALDNLYGTGNSCSSYGNRNFWRMYWDWFGSPTTSAILLRTKANPLVYFMTEVAKYPVTSSETYLSLLPLGGLGYVSEDYLDQFETRSKVTNIFRSAAGAIAILDRGQMFAFPSCGVLGDFGGVCSPTYYTPLTNVQYATYPSGPSMQNLVGTTDGGRYFVSAGVRHEILDTDSQALAGIEGDPLVISPSVVAPLEVGDPYVRNDVIVLERNGTRIVFITGQGVLVASTESSDTTALRSRAAGSLDSASIDRLVANAATFSGAFRETEDGEVKVLVGDTIVDLEAGGYVAPSDVPILPKGIVDLWTDRLTISAGTFIRPAGGATVYYVEADRIRPLSSWAGLLSLSGGVAPAIHVVPKGLVDNLTLGPKALTSGTLVRTTSDPTVYLIDGLTSKIFLPSFAVAAEAGFTQFSYVDQSRLDAYPRHDARLGWGYQCGDQAYIAAGGSLHPASQERASQFPVTYVSISAELCATVPKGEDMGEFIRVPSGAIYQVEDGKKRVIRSWGRWLEISNGATWINVRNEFAALLEDGLPA